MDILQDHGQPGLTQFVQGGEGVRMGLVGSALRISSINQDLAPTTLKIFFNVVSTAIRQQRMRFVVCPESRDWGFLIWAFLEPEVLEKLAVPDTNVELHVSEWNAGLNLCVIGLSAGDGLRPTVMRQIIKIMPHVDETVADFIEFYNVQTVRVFSLRSHRWRRVNLRPRKTESESARLRFCEAGALIEAKTKPSGLSDDQLLGAAVEIAVQLKEFQDTECEAFVSRTYRLIMSGHFHLFFSAEGVPVGYATFEMTEADEDLQNRRGRNGELPSIGEKTAYIVRLYAVAGKFLALALRLRTRLRALELPFVLARE